METQNSPSGCKESERSQEGAERRAGNETWKDETQEPKAGEILITASINTESTEMSAPPHVKDVMVHV